MSACCFIGCSGESPEPAGTVAAGGAVSSGSGGAGGMPVATGGSGGRPSASVLYASFVAETKAGQGPALVHFQNDTKFIMSLWMGQAAFVAVPSGSTVGPELSVSAAVEADTTTGQHKDNACVVFPIKKLDGPGTLEPGFSYSMRIALDEAVGFVGTLTQGPEVPFVAIRAEVIDRTSTAFEPSRVVLDFARSREELRFTTYDEGRTPYVYVGEGELSASVSFVAGSGDRYFGAEPVILGGPPGFTVVVAELPVDRAAAVVPLNRSTE